MRSIYPPNKLFKKISPFLPTFRHRFFEERERLILRDFPITLYERGKNQTISWLGFVYAFLYINKKRRRVLRLERLCSFSEKSVSQNNEIISLLLTECIQLAKFFGSNLLEFEVYRKIGGEIYFPSTLSFVDSYNSPKIISPLKEADFKVRTTEFVFTLPPNIETFNHRETKEYQIRSYGYLRDERKNYWILWSKSPYCMEDLIPHEPDWKLDYNLRGAHDPRFVLFAWKNKKVVGFAHWLPNFYKLSEKARETRSSVWILNDSRRVEGGKIFKVTVDPNLDSKDLRVSLLLNALRTMRNCGLTSYQVGNFFADDILMLDAVKELGGEKLHVIDILEKRI